MRGFSYHRGIARGFDLYFRGFCGGKIVEVLYIFVDAEYNMYSRHLSSISRLSLGQSVLSPFEGLFEQENYFCVKYNSKVMMYANHEMCLHCFAKEIC